MTQTGYAISDGKYRTVSIHNDVGGTVFLPAGRYRVEVVHSFYDYETGRVMHGILLDKKDIAIAQKRGTTEWTEEYYRKTYPTSPALADDVGRAKKAFLNPPKVYFYSTEFECEDYNEEGK